MAIYKWSDAMVSIWDMSAVYKWEDLVRWWKPWANTVAYYPLKEDANDYSGNNRNGTASNVNFTTLNWIECAYFNNSSDSKIT